MSLKVGGSERGSMITHHCQGMRKSTLGWGAGGWHCNNCPSYVSQVGPMASSGCPVNKWSTYFVFLRGGEIFFYLVFDWNALATLDKMFWLVKREHLFRLDDVDVISRASLNLQAFLVN